MVMKALALLAILATEPQFLKGQLHLHSANSGDSATPPSDVARWYATRGYDFIVFTDHNRVTREPSPPGMLVFPGVELTQNFRTCDPAPPADLWCLLHVNALFVAPEAERLIPFSAPTNSARLFLYQRALTTTARMGGIGHLNHPNFNYGADAGLVRRLAQDGLVLMEIANQSWDSNNHPPDKMRPSTEAIWDAVLTAGGRVFGTATDDAHHYFDAAAAAARGDNVFTGDRGFVMVRAHRDAASIRQALVHGDFYASTGVLLKTVERSGETLLIAVDDRAFGAHRFSLIGRSGRVLAEVQGRQARFSLSQAGGGYVRALVVDKDGRRAWVQPIWPGPLR